VVSAFGSPSTLRQAQGSQAQEPWYFFFLFSTIFARPGENRREKRWVKYLAAELPELDEGQATAALRAPPQKSC
jgi:hypothetical protein